MAYKLLLNMIKTFLISQKKRPPIKMEDRLSYNF